MRLNEIEESRRRSLGRLVAVEPMINKRKDNVNSLMHVKEVCIFTAQIQCHAMGATERIDIFHFVEI
jgi:hypothetical protein